MDWPTMVNADEIQSRLILDGVPPDRAMYVHSQLKNIPLGGRLRVEREQGNLFLYPQIGNWFAVAPE